MKSMKRIATYSLLMVMIFNISGYYFVFEFIRLRTRSEMMELFSSPGCLKLEKIVIRQDMKIRFIQSNEFEYCGKMYDVVYSRKQGTQIVYYGLHDSREDKVNNLLAKMTRNLADLLLISVFTSTAILPEQVSGFVDPGDACHYAELVLKGMNGFRPAAEYPPEKCC
jgi:hypothetical protein